MSAVAPEISPASASLARGKGARTMVVKLDRRTREARRVHELRSLYIDALGGERAITPIMLEAVERCAYLVTGAEMARQRYLRSGESINDLVRSENLAGRALAKLGLSTESRKPSIAKYLRNGA